jgi:hypothetical protein
MDSWVHGGLMQIEYLTEMPMDQESAIIAKSGHDSMSYASMHPC